MLYLRLSRAYLGSISGLSRVYLGSISQMLMMAGSESNFFASAPVFVHTIKRLQVFAEIFAEIRLGRPRTSANNLGDISSR